MKNAALVSVLLLASSLDIAPRCGGCGRTDHTAREFSPEVERPQPASAAEEVAQEEPAKAAPLQVAADDDEAEAAEDAAAN